jgi:chromosome segregation ATPase
LILDVQRILKFTMMGFLSISPRQCLLIILLTTITGNFGAQSYTPDLLVRVFSLRWADVRGGGSGGWSRLFRLHPAKKYSKLLQEQTFLLDRQLRQSEEELLQVKKRFKALQEQQLQQTASSVTKERQQEVAQNQIIRTLKQQVAQLEQEISRITAMRDEFQVFLTEQQEKVQTLHDQLATAATESDAAEERFGRQLTALQEELEAEKTKQLEELRIMMEQKMKVALEQARVSAADELKGARVSAAKELKEAVEKTEHRVQQQAEKRLQEEQKKAQKEVEQEKVKMRKLVKALAKREKKLLAQTEKEPKTATRLSPSTADAKHLNARKADTVRGPLK